MKVRISGLRELDAALGELSKGAARAVIRKALRAGAAPIDAEWRRIAPHLTGALEESGGIGTRLTRRQASLARRSVPKPTGGRIHIGPRDPGAVAIEFGTSRQVPQPFLRPAFDSRKDAALAAIIDTLRIEIDRAATRAARRAAKKGVKP